MSKSLFLLFLLFSLILIACVRQLSLTDDSLRDQQPVVEPAESTEKAEEKETKVVVPVADFEARVTKKPFGIFVTPENSPVQPERFSGYHTGLDVEYEDVEDEVAVLAVVDGLVEYAGWVAGYGGVMAIRHLIEGKKYLAIYGHLDPTRLVAQGKSVTKGEQIGILGQGNSYETDGERKHLHFALYTGSDLNLRGYVETEEQLSAWVDPRIFFSSF